MPATDAERLRLHQRLQEVLGADEAAVLMTAVPPVDWSDLVTKEVLRSELTLVRAEMAELRSELEGDFAELRGEFAELRGEFAELRGEFAELRGGISLELAKQTRLFLVTVVTLVLAAMATSFAAAVLA